MNIKTEEMDTYKDFKELSIDELIKGYVKKEEPNEYSCIFCGETFEEGVVYSYGNRMLTAEKAAAEHVKAEHGGSFHSLLDLDKQICGLTDIQKNILNHLYEGNDNKTICEQMDISAATVRTHKFNLQKSKREAKILLALIETVENSNISRSTKPKETLTIEDDNEKSMFEVNSLHPFFTQYKYK